MSPSTEGTMTTNKSNQKRIAVTAILITGGVVFLVLGLVFNVILNSIINKEMREKLALENGSLAFKLWKKPPVPISFGIYVFHVTNPYEVAQGLEQPVVVEKGPYVQRMRIHKTNIVRHDENSTISYVQPQSFVFDREASVGPMEDTFTTINIPYITMASILHGWPSVIQTGANIVFELAGESAFKNLTIHDIFWGYEDPVLEEMQKITEKLHINLPYIKGKFGFFADKNNTGDGNYSIFSGVDGNLERYCHIDLWNGMRKQNLWTTEKANIIEGTDGSMHPPFLTSDSKLIIFDAYLHRTLHMSYVKETSYKGLDTLRFVVPYTEFANASVNPDAAGFCTPNCMLSGCFNLSAASYGAPMYASMPHFCGGDPYYLKQVLGLEPDPAKHQPFYDVHALTGVSIKGSRRYQINIQTKSYEHFTPFKNFPLSYLPILWLDGLSVIDDEDVSTFRDDIQHLLNVMKYLRWAIISLGGFLILIGCGLGVYWYHKNKKEMKKTKEILSNGYSIGSTQNELEDDTSTMSESEPLIKRM